MDAIETPNLNGLSREALGGNELMPNDLAAIYRFATLTGPGLVDAPEEVQDHYLDLNAEERLEFQRAQEELAEKLADSRLFRFFAEVRRHPRTSVGTLFLSLTALTADIEASEFSPKVIFPQIGMIATFNVLGKKFKV